MSYVFFCDLSFFKFKDMLEFFEYLYIDLKFMAISIKVESVDFGIGLLWFELGLLQFFLCENGVIDMIYLIRFCKN